MLTELEAVNQMLKDALGEAPVSTLDSGLPDANSARDTLKRVSGKIQAKGWQVNRQYDYRLTVDVNGNIPVADNVLRIDTSGTDKNTDVVVRRVAGKRLLYDRGQQSFTFTEDYLVGEIVWEYAFEDLTYELQQYITAYATVELQVSDQTSGVVNALLQKQLDDSWAALQDAEAEGEDSNVLVQSRHCRYIARRRSRIANH